MATDLDRSPSSAFDLVYRGPSIGWVKDFTVPAPGPPSTSEETVNIKDFGAFGDGDFHPITQADIDANPQWLGKIEPSTGNLIPWAVGDEWDTVALQEGIYDAFAALSNPASEAVVMNVTTGLMSTDFGNGWIFLLDGVIDQATWFHANVPVSGAFFRFEFPAPTVIDEATWYMAAPEADGIWKWQGSNDGAAWTDIGSSFSVFTSATFVFTSLHGNTTAYKYYQMVGVSGTTDSVGGTWCYEIQFRQDGVYITGNRLGGVIRWNAVEQLLNLNKRLFIPAGDFLVNYSISLVATGFVIDCAARQATNLVWSHPTVNDVPMLKCNSVAYGVFNNLSLRIKSQSSASMGSDGSLLDLDHDSLSPGGLKTQQLTFNDLYVYGGFRVHYGVYISRAGGGAQGDTIAFNNPIISACTGAGLIAGGQNCLNVETYCGDFQALARDAIRVYGGSVNVYATSFQNQQRDFNFGPASNQVINNGWDVNQLAGAGGSVYSTLHGVRSESEMLAHNAGGQLTMDACAVAAGGVNGWFTDFTGYQRGHLIQPPTSPNNSLRRTFIVIEDVHQWFGFNQAGSSGTTVKADGVTWTVNQWAGFQFIFRFTNTFLDRTLHIVSNTIDTLTLDGPLQVDNPSSQYVFAINGANSGLVEPNWDAALTARFYPDGQTSQGFSVTAGSNQLSASSAVNSLAIGDAVVIHDADRFPGFDLLTSYWFNSGFNPQYALIATIIAGAFPGPYTLDRKAGQTATFAGGYWGTPFAVGATGITMMHIPLAPIDGANLITDCTMNIGIPRNIGDARRFVGGQPNWELANYSDSGADNTRVTLIGAKEYRRLGGTIDTGATVDLTTILQYGDTFRYTPTQNATLNAPAPTTVDMARRISMHIKTSGVSSFVITFGTNFKSSGTLTTGVTDGKLFVIVFESSGGTSATWNEVSRSGPL